MGVGAAKPPSVVSVGSSPPSEFDGRENQLLSDMVDRTDTVISSTQQLLQHQERHFYEVVDSLGEDKNALIERMTPNSTTRSISSRRKKT